MKVADPRWLNQLAAEYVLGTLRGAARRRFERELADTNVMAAVAAWEARLAPLTVQITPVQPGPAAWSGIQRRLGLTARAVRTRRAGWRGGGLALAAAVAIVVIGTSVRVWHESHAFRAAATLASSDGHALWQLDVSRSSDELRVTVLGVVQPLPGKDYELWALPEAGSPVSLGLLPSSGRIERGLDSTQRRALAAAHKVAVSIEPRGGSRTGAPTGPVVHVAPVRVAAAAVKRSALPG